MPSTTQLRALFLRASSGSRPTATATAPLRLIRPYHYAPPLRQPYKDDQDRQTLRPRSSQGTKSGTDDDVAAHQDAAFNPKKTRPEHAKETAERNSGGATSPLEVSGANPEVSKPQSERAGGGERQADGGGSGKKKKKSAGGSGKSGKHPNVASSSSAGLWAKKK